MLHTDLMSVHPIPHRAGLAFYLRTAVELLSQLAVSAAPPEA
jgi:hypothetical protein